MRAKDLISKLEYELRKAEKKDIQIRNVDIMINGHSVKDVTVKFYDDPKFPGVFPEININYKDQTFSE